MRFSEKTILFDSFFEFSCFLRLLGVDEKKIDDQDGLLYLAMDLHNERGALEKIAGRLADIVVSALIVEMNHTDIAQKVGASLFEAYQARIEKIAKEALSGSQLTYLFFEEGAFQLKGDGEFNGFEKSMVHGLRILLIAMGIALSGENVPDNMNAVFMAGVLQALLTVESEQAGGKETDKQKNIGSKRSRFFVSIKSSIFCVRSASKAQTERTCRSRIPLVAPRHRPCSSAARTTTPAPIFPAR